MERGGEPGLELNRGSRYQLSLSDIVDLRWEGDHLGAYSLLCTGDGVGDVLYGRNHLTAYNLRVDCGVDGLCPVFGASNISDVIIIDNGRNNLSRVLGLCSVDSGRSACLSRRWQISSQRRL